MRDGRRNSTLGPRQFPLANLFVLTFLAAVLLGAWRFGLTKLAAIIAITTGVLLVLVWIILMARRLFR